jgi:hypothetical protein
VNLKSQLEPNADLVSNFTTSEGIVKAAEVSTAISLKRIADAFEKQMFYRRVPIAGGQTKP